MSILDKKNATQSEQRSNHSVVTTDIEFQYIGVNKSSNHMLAHIQFVLVTKSWVVDKVSFVKRIKFPKLC